MKSIIKISVNMDGIIKKKKKGVSVNSRNGEIK